MFKTVKSKLLRFKQDFHDGWDQFVFDDPKHNTYHDTGEVKKRLKCGRPEGGFMTFKCMECGKGEHKVNLRCKGHFCPQCGKRYARECVTKYSKYAFQRDQLSANSIEHARAI